MEMLPKVSRTFAPTIRLLPNKLSQWVTVAYLLCRIADTIEDDVHLDKDEKQRLLQEYANIFTKGAKTHKENFLSGIQNIPEHSTDVSLAKNLDKVISVYQTFNTAVRKQISIWVVEMSLGMKKFAQERSKKKFQFLRSMKELDEYTYYVAGTVGHMLTSLFAHFSKKITPPIVKRLEQFSESFGKGLQLVNIIRDMKGDLRRGQSYIPDEILKKYRLNRQSIFKAEQHEQAEKLFNELIQTAVGHLDRALDYIITLPKEETRIRLFCLLPVCWAMQTLRIIQMNTLALLQSEKIKVSRKTIRIEFFKSLILIFSNRLTIRHYRKIRKNIRPEPLLQI